MDELKVKKTVKKKANISRKVKDEPKESKKGTPLYVLKVLEKYSDVNNILTQQQIIDYIDTEFHKVFDRRTISAAIDDLRSFEYNIEQVKNKGYYLKTRLFSQEEASYLIDAVFSSKSIDSKNAIKLTNKIQSGLSMYDKKNFKYLYKTEEINRTENTKIMENIRLIQQAIKEEKLLCFKYSSYDKEGKPTNRKGNFEYRVSPYYLINNFGRYYLLCYYGYNQLSNYRIEYMNDIHLIDEYKGHRYTPIREVPSLNGVFNISEYINEHIYLFGGRSVNCQMILNNEGVIQYVKDWFGNKVKITCHDEIITADVRCNEHALFYWLMQYGEHVKVTFPKFVVERVVNAAKAIVEKYE